MLLWDGLIVFIGGPEIKFFVNYFLNRSVRFSGGGRGNPLQYSCLENSVDRGA